MSDPQISITLTDDTAHVRIIGEVTFRNAVGFKKTFGNLLLEGVIRFEIDLAECVFIDSTFMGILLGLGLKIKAVDGGHLRLVNANPQIFELLKNLGLDRLFF